MSHSPTRSSMAATTAAIGTILLMLATTVPAQGVTGPSPTPAEYPVDSTATVESDTITTDEPVTDDDVSLPALSAGGGYYSSYTLDADGQTVLYSATSGDTWWDGVCTDGQNRYTIIKKYVRPKDHARMEGDYAKMYCGKKDRSSEAPASESPFGIRHIRPYKKSQFGRLAADEGTTWGNWMHWAIAWTISEPSWRVVQNADRYCYEKLFGFKSPNGTHYTRYVVVILGRTGQRIITSYPRKEDYCVGDRF